MRGKKRLSSSRRSVVLGKKHNKKTKAKTLVSEQKKSILRGIVAGTYSSSLYSMPTQLSVPYYSHCYSQSRLTSNRPISK